MLGVVSRSVVPLLQFLLQSLLSVIIITTVIIVVNATIQTVVTIV